MPQTKIGTMTEVNGTSHPVDVAYAELPDDNKYFAFFIGCCKAIRPEYVKIEDIKLSEIMKKLKEATEG